MGFMFFTEKVLLRFEWFLSEWEGWFNNEDL